MENQRIKKAGRLNVKLLESRKALGELAAAEATEALKAVIREKGSCHVIFAAAPSQNEFLAALCASDVDWTKVYAYHMDEYIGLAADAPQGFGNFLRRSIFERVPFAGVEYLNGGAADVEQELQRYAALLQENPADIVFMGIGENGHIAFNDPHVAHFDDVDLVKKVALDERCRQQQVNDGCFEKLEEVPTHALTLTIPALMQAKQVFCMVPAATKAEAVGKTVMGEIREQVPASILRLHLNANLYVDPDSGKELLTAGWL
ncbi:MAG: glucosamine-6-phosphate deaminase [Lachnospiraceae bacterium]|jgi:glucosamine-6-phosphate deaminase|nr:glucosamine-6-phosphate deaminase [Lachnospiraceae bacterium]